LSYEGLRFIYSET